MLHEFYKVGRIIQISIFLVQKNAVDLQHLGHRFHTRTPLVGLKNHARPLPVCPINSTASVLVNIIHQYTNLRAGAVWIQRMVVMWGGCTLTLSKQGVGGPYGHHSESDRVCVAGGALPQDAPLSLLQQSRAQGVRIEGKGTSVLVCLECYQIKAFTTLREFQSGGISLEKKFTTAVPRGQPPQKKECVYVKRMYDV